MDHLLVCEVTNAKAVREPRVCGTWKDMVEGAKLVQILQPSVDRVVYVAPKDFWELNIFSIH